MFELIGSNSQQAVIKVIGIGGGGGNAVEHMLGANIEGVDFICANTDAQALKKSGVSSILQLGEQITKGLGAGADPQVGRKSAEADREQIKRLLQGADMVFITAGMGGGTGTGAAPVVAEVARDMGILTVAVVTKPFAFEGKKRMQVAKEGILALNQYVDSLITIPNDKLLSVLGKDVSLLDAFKAANNVLLGAVQGIAELITKSGLINVDFADVRTVMSEMGVAVMGSGTAKGEDRARKAAETAIASPLLEDTDLAGARGVLVNVTAGPNMSIGEFQEVGDIIKNLTSENATVVVGTVIDPQLTDELRVTIIVTGLEQGVARSHPTVAAAVVPAIVKPLIVEAERAPTPALSEAIDYSSLDKPTLVRQQQQPKLAPTAAADKDLEYLDIPAFLRRHEEANN
jgi:cell division protein FtsZ